MKINIPFTLIFALAIEVLLLILIAIILLLALVGIFLPFLPGLFFVGLAIGIYTLMMKAGYTKISSRAHPHFFYLRDKIINLKITKKIMAITRVLTKRKEEKAKEEILKNGLILLGFNSALILAFIFGFLFISVTASLLRLQGVLLAFAPLLLIFVFAGGSAIVWYRFGQILGGHFKKKKTLNSALVVLISVLPFLALLILLSTFITFIGGDLGRFLAMIFLGFLLMSVLSAVFEVLIVSLGVMTSPKN